LHKVTSNTCIAICRLSENCTGQSPENAWPLFFVPSAQELHTTIIWAQSVIGRVC